MILRQTLRWTFYALIALQPLAIFAWAAVMKGSAHARNSDGVGWQ